MATKTFGRRTYRSLAEVWSDLMYIMEQRPLLRQAMNGLIPLDFRERLMLVVTEVNDCRYCSYFHSRQALKSGVPATELETLLAGQIPPETPSGEHVALLFAQHWAEADANPDGEAVERLIETYGEQKAAAIEIVLRMIRVGNLLGNSADYVLHKLSFGLLGRRKAESLLES